jgi:hypothetical protein
MATTLLQPKSEAVFGVERAVSTLEGHSLLDVRTLTSDK